ncbi:RNA polymerase sigma factor [uncultured Ruminococcus sp.]|uniref:RNA polymerase sigma factor n=1 Tax=uncultured Ruminococcus sp. TaxID=165186 RepID=UPI002674A109|nr:sigma-70 family RNA polymerase sigma factor [uncultured Ruminococcus sp.]
MLHATTWESCPAELLLSAAAPEDTGKDARLLEQLKQQNRRGLERVMKRYTAYVGTILRNVTRGQTTQEDLEELTADVFLALWHHAPEMRTEHLTGYLASIARSKGYNWLRKNRPETMPIDDVVISDDTDVSAQAEQAELADIVQEVLAQLPEQDRELLLRFYFYRQSVREIAGEMHMKESTVKTRMYRSRVLASLDEEAAAGVPARSHAPHWKMGRIPAVLIAAAVLVSGSAITAAAATGGFSQLMQLVFGKDVSYPSTLEELYAVPEVKMTDTCEDIDCQVLGVFGDEHTVNFVLEFSGVNGFQLPETPRFFGEFPWIESDASTGGSSKMDYIYDASDNGHWYVTIHNELDQIDFKSHPKVSMEIEKFLTGSNAPDAYLRWDWAWDWGGTYDMWDIRNWLGYSMADINTKKPLSAEDWQKVSENFELLDQMSAIQHGNFSGEKWQNDDERVYLLKSDILTEGGISMEFDLDYPMTKTVTDSFTFTDSETGKDTPMTMELSPWGVSFTWKPTDPMPRVFGYVTVNEHDILNGSCTGYVRTPDGLTRQVEKKRKDLDNLFYRTGHVPYVYVDQAYDEGSVTLYMSFLEPVDPDQVQEVYAEDGTLMWKK